MRHSKKALALAKFLGEKAEDWDQSSYDPCYYHCGDREYRVLTDKEANAAAKEYIRESLWAFNPSFLLAYVPDGLREKDLSLIQERCEDANPTILALVGKHFNRLVKHAIQADGRGHFLSNYDGQENEEGGFFIYRNN